MWPVTSKLSVSVEWNLRFPLWWQVRLPCWVKVYFIKCILFKCIFTINSYCIVLYCILDRCIGQLLVDTQSMVGRHFVHSRKIAVRYIGRESADSRSICRARFLSVCIVLSPLSIALEKKLEQDYWNINRLPPLTHGDSWKIRIFGHFSVSYESKLLKIKHESMPFFAIASRFVTFFGTGMPKSLTQSL